MSNYTVQNLLADLAELQVGAHYKYVKLQGGSIPANECIFQGVDPQNRTLSYSRVASPQNVDVISTGTFDTVARALLSGHPCNLDVVLQGGGNNRSIFEALLANTRHVFACMKNRRKHIILIPAKEHPVGEIKILTEAELPTAIASANLPSDDTPRQLITYGAPGTGKSHRTKLETEGHTVYRTTFHPDSDYSTFVGAYKPTMRPEQRINCIDDKAKAVKDADGKPSMQDVISYDFVPQAFIKAYVDAWRKWAGGQVEKEGGGGEKRVEPVFLVIEEINRGNCAQIFGDLFQLLDRNEEGYSEYAVDADADLARWLGAKLGGGRGNEDGGGTSGGRGATALPADVASGKKLVLPPNLYIRATMNTSDQSLFPIDSAFKRRWDWEYVPIRDEGKGWYVKVGADRYEWWSFLEKINAIVYEETQSADKQMGYFFVKLAEGQTEIDLKKFVNKVAFYLWNDVFKDCEIREDALKLTDANGQYGEPIKFTDFFAKNSNVIDENVVKDLFEGLGVKTMVAESDAGEGPAAEEGN